MLVVTNYLLHVSNTHNKQTEHAANLLVVLQPWISEYTGADCKYKYNNARNTNTGCNLQARHMAPMKVCSCLHLCETISGSYECVIFWIHSLNTVTRHVLCATVCVNNSWLQNECVLSDYHTSYMKRWLQVQTADYKSKQTPADTFAKLLIRMELKRHIHCFKICCNQFLIK